MKSENLGYYLERAWDLPPQVVMKKALIKPVAIATRKLEKAREGLSCLCLRRAASWRPFARVFNAEFFCNTYKK